MYRPTEQLGVAQGRSTSTHKLVKSAADVLSGKGRGGFRRSQKFNLEPRTTGSGSVAAGALYVCVVSSRFSISATDCLYCLSG